MLYRRLRLRPTPHLLQLPPTPNPHAAFNVSVKCGNLPLTIGPCVTIESKMGDFFFLSLTTLRWWEGGGLAPFRCSTIDFACQHFGAVLVGRVGPGRPHQRLCAFFKPLVKSIPRQPCSHQTGAADEPPPPSWISAFPPQRAPSCLLCVDLNWTLWTLLLCSPQLQRFFQRKQQRVRSQLCFHRSSLQEDDPQQALNAPRGCCCVLQSLCLTLCLGSGASRQISQAGGEAAEPARPGGPAGTGSGGHLCRVGPHSSSARV